ncbi:MAG TPA: type 4a pilus biogenesis protein PilO [Terriglobales bacterium]|jgi:type IV pilus assembly protein PilO|nr:type 4a pilus biogenesis protein PilO [Terriglobales bacterium]
MAKFNELEVKQQIGIVVVLALLATGALYYTTYKTMIDANKVSMETLDRKKAENAQLEPFVSKKAEMESTLAVLKGQLDTLNRIVPSEKEASQFMQMMQAEAASAGIEVRRYSARPTANQEFFTEVPFDMELDGAYFAMLNFFQRVGGLERIINISGMRMASVIKPGPAGLKKTYQYAPSESVVVSCIATTYFSKDAPAPVPAPAPAAGKKN